MSQIDPPSRKRQILRSREVRPDLLKPVLNMGRFFVGDAIPVITDPVEINQRLKGIKERGLEVSEPAEALLTKLLMELVKLGPPSRESAELREAFGLLAGLVFLVAEDDYFYVPKTTRHVGPEQLTELAQTFLRSHRKRQVKVLNVVAQYNLSLERAEGLEELRAKLPVDEELEGVLGRLSIHLRQGQQLLERNTDPQRRQAHQRRFSRACTCAVELIGRLLAISAADDHPRLRARLTKLALKQIEVDALGAAVISDAEQALEAAKLLAQTGVAVDEGATSDPAEIAAQLAAMRAAEAAEAEGASAGEAAAEPAAAEEEEEEGGWFFDME